MADTASRLSGKSDDSMRQEPLTIRARMPLDGLRGEIDRMFESFQREFWPGIYDQPAARLHSWSAGGVLPSMPAVDIVNTDKSFEITADVPGLTEKDIQVKLVDGDLLIKGERQAAKEEKKKDYYLQERSFGSFERRFRLPDGIDRNRVEASFSKGVLRIILPKTAEAQQAAKEVEVKAA